MIKLVDLILSDILPERLKTKEILAVAAALDKQMKEITEEIDSVIMIPHIDQMPEDIVDSLAWQFHVDFYHSLGLDLDMKRALVKNSLDWHRRKGTKSVVEEIVRTLFFPDFRVEEWFEYDGRPYFFRCVIGSQPVNHDELSEAIAAIYATKNERSWLDYIVFEQEVDTNTYLAGVIEDDITELFSMMNQPEAIDATLYMGAVLDDFIIEGLFDEPPPSEINKTTYMASALDDHEIELFDTTAPQATIAAAVYMSCGISEHIKELFIMDFPSEITSRAYVGGDIDEFIKEEIKCP